MILATIIWQAIAVVGIAAFAAVILPAIVRAGMRGIE